MLSLPLSLTSMHQSTDLYIFTLLANLLRQPISFIYIFILSRCVNKLSCVWLCLLSSLFLVILWVLLRAQVAFPGSLDHSNFQPLDQLSHSAKGQAPRRWLSGSVLLQLIPFLSPPPPLSNFSARIILVLQKRFLEQKQICRRVAIYLTVRGRDTRGAGLIKLVSALGKCSK